MLIKKTARGWLVEPSTSDGEKALEFFLHALEQTYGAGAKTDSSPDASVVSRVESQTQTREEN